LDNNKGYRPDTHLEKMSSLPLATHLTNKMTHLVLFPGSSLCESNFTLGVLKGGMVAQERGYDAATHRNTLGQVLHIRLHRRQKRSQNTWPDPDLIEQYLQMYTSNNNTAYQDIN